MCATVVAERLCFHKRLSFCPQGEGYILLTRHSPRDGHCSGRYASYWNAFLLNFSFFFKHNLYFPYLIYDRPPME